MKNLLIFLVLAVTISATFAKRFNLNKVAKEKIAQQVRDLGDEGSDDWGQGGEESDVVAFLVVAEPNGYAFDVNVLAAPGEEEEYEDSGDDDIDWYNYDGGNDENNGNGDENDGDNNGDENMMKMRFNENSEKFILNYPYGIIPDKKKFLEFNPNNPFDPYGFIL